MTTVLEFHIPLSREDLLKQGDRNHYVVSECCTAAEVTSNLEGTHAHCSCMQKLLCVSFKPVLNHEILKEQVCSELACPSFVWKWSGKEGPDK